VRRDRQARQERCGLVWGIARPRPPATFEHEPTVRKRPRAYGRPPRAADRGRQRRYVGVELVQLRHRPRDGERELRARSQSIVPRNRALNPKMRPSALYAVVIHEPRRESNRALGLRALGRYLRSHLGREQERRRRNGRANAAKPPAERAREVEHAEMQSRRGLDKDRHAVRSRT
jgi:hypothetical protein